MYTSVYCVIIQAVLVRILSNSITSISSDKTAAQAAGLAQLRQVSGHSSSTEARWSDSWAHPTQQGGEPRQGAMNYLKA